MCRKVPLYILYRVTAQSVYWQRDIWCICCTHHYSYMHIQVYFTWSLENLATTPLYSVRLYDIEMVYTLSCHLCFVLPPCNYKLNVSLSTIYYSDILYAETERKYYWLTIFHHKILWSRWHYIIHWQLSEGGKDLGKWVSELLRKNIVRYNIIHSPQFDLIDVYTWNKY